MNEYGPYIFAAYGFSALMVLTLAVTTFTAYRKAKRRLQQIESPDAP